MASFRKIKTSLAGASSPTVRHPLTRIAHIETFGRYTPTAETVIAALEDSEDYQAFEQAFESKLNVLPDEQEPMTESTVLNPAQPEAAGMSATAAAKNATDKGQSPAKASGKEILGEKFVP